MRNLTDCNRPEEDYRIRHPDQGDQDIDRPLQFGVLLAAGDTQRQSHGGQDDDQLPPPEGERNQRTTPQAGVAGALHNPVRSGEECAATKSENHCIGMQRTQTAKVQPGTDIQLRPHQLCSDDDTDKHADDAPDDGHDGKLPYDLIVICGLRSRHEPTSR